MKKLIEYVRKRLVHCGLLLAIGSIVALIAIPNLIEARRHG